MSYTQLTEIEIQALNGILDSEFMDGAKGSDTIGRHVWAWSANPFENRKVFSGACSMLHQKGLVKRSGEGASRTLAITKRGFQALEASQPARPSKPAAKAVRKPLQPVQPLTNVRLPSQPWTAPSATPSQPARIVTARPPRKAGRPRLDSQPMAESSQPTIMVGSIIKLLWQSRTVIAEIIAESEKAWKLVALDQNNQNGFECWFPKTSLEHVSNSSYKLADWFIERNNHHGNYNMSWMWHNAR